MDAKPNPPPKKKSKQTMVSLGLYPTELDAVHVVMERYDMGLSAAVRLLIRKGAMVLDVES